MKKILSMLVAVSIFVCGFAIATPVQAATTLTISPASVVIEKGSTKKLAIKINKKSASNSKCSYSSSSKSVATVSSSGVITAKKAGTATITVRLKSNKKVKKQCKVRVVPKVVLNASSKTMYVGNKERITLKVDGKAYDQSKCNFTSSNTGVATVSSSGYITAKKAGTATVTVKLKSNSYAKKTCKVTVKTQPIKTDATALNFIPGGTKTMKVVLNGANAGGGSLNYSTSNSSIVTISKNGLITAKKPGTATVTATSKKNSKIKVSTKITVLGGNNFSISTSSLPLNGKYMNYAKYGSSTRPYFVLRSYMDGLETLGGGTLTIQPGTYNVSNVVYVPSKVTVKLKDGVVLNKTDQSGTMFMLCAPSKSEKTAAYSKYNGVHDVSFIGEGNATISMKNAPKSTSAAFVLCHNQNIKFENIKFTDLSSVGHYVELDASKNVRFTNCTFQNEHKGNIKDFDECVNLDVPDKNTGGITQPWITYDKTPNDTVIFSNCTFNKVQSGVGTHTYTGGVYHKNVRVENCKFYNCAKAAVNPKNWKNSSITNNTFNGVGMDTNAKAYTSYQNGKVLSNDTYAIYCAGADNLTIEGNTFKNVYNAMVFNASTSKYYPTTYNQMNREDYIYYADNNNLYGSTVKNYYVNAMYVGKHNENEDFESPVRFDGTYIPENAINYQ